MKGLKQTRLSFAPAPNAGTPSTRCSNNTASSAAAAASNDSPSKTPRPKKGAQATNGRARAMDCVEIPPPPKRSSRTQPQAKSSRASPAKLARRNAAASSARKPSLKRKLSVGPDTDEEVEKEAVPALHDMGSSTSSKDKSRTPSISKKIRLSSPESDLTTLPSSSAYGGDAEEFVPTSQSDEQELTMPRVSEVNPATVKENVAKWREETHASPPSRAQSPPPLDPICTSFDDAPMDVYAETTVEGSSAIQYPQTPRSLCGGSSHQFHIDAAAATVTRPSALATSASQLETPTRPGAIRDVPVPEGLPSDAFSSLTPPPSSDPASPADADEQAPLVQALDVKSKTEQLIADIKARAFAAAHSSSPEQSPVDINALSDSDSDSSDDDLPGGFSATFTRDVKGKGKAKATENPTKAGPSKPETASAPRYNLRRGSPPKKATKPPAPAPTQQRKQRKTNPLDALLREKEREERTGTGMAAIRAAEASFAAAKAKEEAKKGLKDEMMDEEESESEDDWTADVAGLGAAARSTKKGKAPQTPSRTKAWKAKAKAKGADASGSEDEHAIAGIDCEAILGAKGGKAVGKILENDLRDKKARALAKLNEEPVGVPLWDTAAAKAEPGDGMDVDFALPSFAAEAGDNAMVKLFVTAIQSNDATQASALLASGMVTFLQPDQYATVVPWLFETVFSNVLPALRTLAYTQLMRLAPLLGEHPSGLHSPSIISALVRLGAPRSTIEKYGWAVPPLEVAKLGLESDQRDEMVYRLVTITGAFARASMREELRELFVIMLLIGMDPTTSAALLTEIRQSCDSIARAMEAAQGETCDMEATLCEMVVTFGKTLSPVNQSLLVSLFPCVSPSTIRIARNVSRSLLVDSPASPCSYDKLPDLAPIIDLLTPRAGRGGYFDVTGNTEKEGFYDELACRVSLLSRVLSDVDEYVLLEIQAAKEKAAKEKAAKEKERTAQEKAEQKDIQDEEKEKEKEEQQPVLEQIRVLLEKLHGRIVDTRAAHLDRSRVKAAIQRLYLRVHYQRTATLRSGSGTGRPGNIRAYFTRPS
ncbi:hypothetical protein BV20DRAFT_969398 [Pilatotrama ljubarskyi]|nr:hypothetical protein BV20DRAFT_969398 [Pilatotrama ljubarskyi]